MNILLIVIGVIALGLLALFVFPRRQEEEAHPKEHKQLPDGGATNFLADDNKKLTGENARQWLDDFLKRQQS